MAPDTGFPDLSSISDRIYKAIGETIPFGVWVTDPDGGAIYLSDSFLELVGMTMEECAEFGWSSRLPPGNVERTLDDWKKTAKSGDFWDYEHHILGTDGHYHVILSRGVPVRDVAGDIICWAGINLDITERKRNEEMLRIIAEELDRYAQVVSHDLRSPLAIIDLQAQTAERAVREGRPEIASECLQQIRDVLGHLTGLATSLLEYAEAGRPGGYPAQVDPNRIIQDVLGDFGAETEAMSIEFDVEKDFPPVIADAVKLHQVISNVVDNAIKNRAPEREMHIRIGWEHGIDLLTVFVEDNGVGIPNEKRDLVFEPFKSYPEERTRRSGIGLSTVKRNVEGWGGQAWIESVLGSGTTIYFTIPPA